MKKTMSQKNKLHLNELSDLFMTRNKIIKNTTYYNRLYSTKPTSINISLSLSNNNPTNLFLSQNISMNKNNIDNSNINTKEINKNKITNRKILSVKNKSIWPKVTKPKWPFSLKRNEPRELRMSRLSSATPSEKYHNFNTIRWLNQKYSDSVKPSLLRVTRQDSIEGNVEDCRALLYTIVPVANSTALSTVHLKMC
jgi:hypothetical protein